MRVILTSTSEIKKEALLKFLNSNLIPYDEILYINTVNPDIPNQPVQEVLKCAQMRTSSVNSNKDDLVISIENGIIYSVDVGFCDIIAVYAKYQDKEWSYVGDNTLNSVYFDKKYYYEAKVKSEIVTKLGMSTTVGELIARDYNVPSNNWMKHPDFNLDRVDQIYNALASIINIDNMLLHLNVLYDSTFKPGVVFKDLSPILANSYLKFCLNRKIIDKTYDLKMTKIVGIDSRGYIYSMMINSPGDPCNVLGPGFVMARKSGKTPGKFRSQSYGTEYSQDAVEIQEGLIKPNDKVLIVDDLIATGGSICAVKKLVESFGAEVLGALVILQVDNLISNAQEQFGKPIYVVL